MQLVLPTNTSMNHDLSDNIYFQIGYYNQKEAFQHHISPYIINKAWLGHLVNWKETFATGAGTGAILAMLVSLIMIKIGVEPPSAGSALAIFIGMIVVSAWTVKKISLKTGWCKPSLKQLIPISFLTFLMPLLGASFGAPNSQLTTIAIIILLGIIGGIFWSLPFVIISIYKIKKLRKSQISGEVADE